MVNKKRIAYKAESWLNSKHINEMKNTKNNPNLQHPSIGWLI